MLKRTIIAIIPLIILLAIPMALRPSAPKPIPGDDQKERLVIITPHSEAIKHEFALAFSKFYREKYNQDIVVEYRSVGGTSDIVRYVGDQFAAAFRRHWQSNELQPTWSETHANAFANPYIDLDEHNNIVEVAARKEFLNSDVGIGIDIFWGGGTFELSRTAARGFAVDGGVQKRHPEYFDPEVIPKSFGGELMYDPKGRFYGTCLASFGICYSPQRLKEMSDSSVPTSWEELGTSRFFNTISISDPTKSGSVNKCFESILQQLMFEAVSACKDKKNGCSQGWANGLNLIKRIVANARTITDSASKTPRDIAAGESAAGMAIDVYGLSEQDWSERIFDGKPTIRYSPPKGGTAVSADPIQLLRGAPNRQAAEAFMDFLLSKAGQKLWNYRVNVAGGPTQYALRRPPIRKDLYQEKYTQYFSDPDYNPYIAGADFTYHPKWTSPYFGLIRIMVRTLALDVQEELSDAWRAIIKAGGPEKVPEAMAEFNRLPFDYKDASAAKNLLRVSNERSVLDVNATCRKWSEEAIANYKRAKALAKAGR